MAIEGFGVSFFEAPSSAFGLLLLDSSFLSPFSPPPPSFFAFAFARSFASSSAISLKCCFSRSACSRAF